MERRAARERLMKMRGEFAATETADRELDRSRQAMFEAVPDTPYCVRDAQREQARAS